MHVIPVFANDQHQMSLHDRNHNVSTLNLPFLFSFQLSPMEKIKYKLNVKDEKNPRKMSYEL